MNKHQKWLGGWVSATTSYWKEMVLKELTEARAAGCNPCIRKWRKEKKNLGNERKNK